MLVSSIGNTSRTSKRNSVRMRSSSVSLVHVCHLGKSMRTETLNLPIFLLPKSDIFTESYVHYPFRIWMIQTWKYDSILYDFDDYGLGLAGWKSNVLLVVVLSTHSCIALRCAVCCKSFGGIKKIQKIELFGNYVLFGWICMGLPCIGHPSWMSSFTKCAYLKHYFSIFKG